MRLSINSESSGSVKLINETASGRSEVYFKSDTPLAASAEVALSASLLPAMRLGRNMEIGQPVSATLLGSLGQVQDIYRNWERSLCRVAITAPASAVEGGQRVGTFFSGGLDSFYTLLKHADEITDVIFVHGFDIKLNNRALFDMTLANIKRAADGLGKNVISIETNLRELLDPHATWGKLAHGAALATIGHLLGREFKKVYIPATHTYADLFPWGSHPVLDHLWSTESLEFIHDGAEARRVDKAGLVATSDVALSTLRVCYKNPGGAYNCGRCEKCIRTQINLLAHDALDRCTTFDSRVTAEDARAIAVLDDNTRSFVQENLEELERQNIAPEMQQALREALKRGAAMQSQRKGILHRIKRRMRRIVTSA